MTIDNFPVFAKTVTTSFQALVKSPNVFVVDVDGDLYAHYLAAFPAGSNPLFRNKTEHDCGSCKHFIRRAGTVVTVDDNGELSTVWDRAADDQDLGPYAVVASRLCHVVRAATVVDGDARGRHRRGRLPEGC